MDIDTLGTNAIADWLSNLPVQLLQLQMVVITTAKIANDAVTGAKIGNDAVVVVTGLTCKWFNHNCKNLFLMQIATAKQIQMTMYKTGAKISDNSFMTDLWFLGVDTTMVSRHVDLDTMIIQHG